MINAINIKYNLEISSFLTVNVNIFKIKKKKKDFKFKSIVNFFQKT